jgi:hypothetical protein
MPHDKPKFWPVNYVLPAFLSASSELTGFPIANVADWRSTLLWRGQRDKPDDISQTQEDTTIDFATATGFLYTGMVFKIDKRCKLKEFKVKLAKVLTPANDVRFVLTPAIDDPAVPPISYSHAWTGTKAEADITGAMTEYTISCGYDIEPDIYYALWMELLGPGSPSDTDYYQTRKYAASSVYADGHYCSYPAGGPWAAHTAEDLYFQLVFDYTDTTIDIDFGEEKAPEAILLYGCSSDLIERTLDLHYSDDGINYAPTPIVSFQPNANGTAYASFSGYSKRWWRLIIPTLADIETAETAILYLGEEVQSEKYPEAGFDPDGRNRDFKLLRSNEGRMLGNIESWQKRFWRLQFRRVTTQWIDLYMNKIWDSEALLFSWDPGLHADEIYLASVMNEDLISPYTQTVFKNFMLDMEGEVS